MNKLVVLFLALTCVAVLLVGCDSQRGVSTPDVPPDVPDARHPSIMVDDTIYFCRWTEVYRDEINEDDILGKIESKVPLSQMPAENDQTNMRGILDAPYARYGSDIVVKKEGSWILFEKEDKR